VKPKKRKKAAKKAPPVKVPKLATPEDQIPRIVENPALSDHLAIITRAIMQAGMSWAFIDARWDDYVKAFDGFDVEKVARQLRKSGIPDLEKRLRTLYRHRYPALGSPGEVIP